MKRHLSRTLAWTTLAVVTLAFSLTGAEAQPKRLLVVTATKGFRHSSIPVAEKVLAQLGERSGAFTVDYARGGPNGRDDAEIAEKLSPDALKQYDGVVFANTTGDLAIPDKQAFLDWIKSGKAFIGMHSASDTFHGYPPFIEMLGGEFLTHGAQVEVECLNQDPAHPACKHLGPSWTVFDEIYILKNFHRERVHGLLWLDKHPNKGVPGDYPIAWAKQVGQGRVFYTSLGHREDIWDPQWTGRDGQRKNSPAIAEAYQQHLLGGIKWALGLEKGDARPQDLTVHLSPEEQRAGFRPLFNGVDLTGWKLRRPDGHPSWSAQNGMLVNEIGDQHGTDLVSEEKFKDFTVRYEYMVPKGANSGFYLRGRYEIQILDDFGREPTPGGNGAIYSLKPASRNVSRPAGQWQTVEATIRGNRVTVTLNGVKIHEDVEVPRPTGGQLDEAVDEPGPIMLQGDHGAVAFRNLRIKPLN